MKKILVVLAVFMSYSLMASESDRLTNNSDTLSVEHWRKLGFEARVAGDDELALKYYLRVLTISNDDCDANLAVARLYFNKEMYDDALKYYKKIFSNDPKDVEALWGMGRCNFRSGKFEEAIKWYSKADNHLPDHTPLLLDIANAFVAMGELKKATNAFKRVIDTDSINVDAWAGIGRMYYWQGKPASAIKYYKIALKLDPENKDLQEQKKRVKGELTLTVTYSLQLLNEAEPVAPGSEEKAYDIDAIINRVVVNKRLNDRLFISFSSLIDRSHRQYYSLQEEQKRWFDNTHLRAMLIFGGNKISVHGGGSIEENQLTTYGFSWDITKRYRHFTIANVLSAGYEYYYYWNQVGHDFVSNNLKITVKNFVLDGVYRYADVRELYLLDLDTIGRNIGHLYNVSARYTFFENPKISLGVYHQYRDYKYRSTRYWSPQDRKLNGATMGLYWSLKEKFYIYLYGNIGKDNYDIEHWEASGEAGYNFKTFSLSLSASKFYNEWYENANVTFTLSKRF